MSQLHKKFTDSQVKELIERYSKGGIKRKYIQEILGIGKSRFFDIVKEYRESPDGFSVQYIRKTKTRRIPQEIEGNIMKELKIEKELIENRDVPLRHYNYSYVKDRIEKEYLSKNQ